MTDTHIQLTPTTAVEAKAAAAQAAAQDSASPRWTHTAREIGGVTRTTWNNGVATTDTDAGVVKDADSASPSATDGQMVVARSASGSTLTGRSIRPDSIVTVGNMETSVAAALASGLLYDTGNGYAYGDGTGNTPVAQQQKQPEPQQPPADDKLADLPAEAHALVTETMGNIGANEHQAAMTEIVTTGQMTDEIVTAIATQLGKTPDQVRATAASIRGAYENQARAMVGPDADAIFQWCHQNQPALYSEAVKQHTQFENPRAYDQVKQAYFLAWTPEQVMASPNAAQFEPRMENGTLTVKVPGTNTRTSWRAYIRSRR